MESAIESYKQSREAVDGLIAALEQERQNLNRAQECLNAERAAFIAEAALVGEVLPTDRVLLNIGGTNFDTTRRVLTAVPDSMLGVMFSGRHEGRLRPDGEERVFIDRNPSMFEYILEFLRRFSNGCDDAAFGIHMLSGSNTAQIAIRRELDYYNLESAVFPFTLDDKEFSEGPEMVSERSEFGAVVLTEKKTVILVGGCGSTIGKSSTECLDMHTETFSLGPPLGQTRIDCSASVLENGKVMVLGELIGGHRFVMGTEMLDVSSSDWRWYPGPRLDSPYPRSFHLSLGDNEILSIGGICSYHAANNNGIHCLNTTQLFNLTDETTRQGPKMTQKRYKCSAVVLRDGRVLVVGGRDAHGRYLSSTEILDLADSTSSPGPDMSIGREGTLAVLIPGSTQVLVIGGGSSTREAHYETEVIDVLEGSTFPGPRLGMSRSFASAVQLPRDRVLVMGGYDNSGRRQSTTEILSIMPLEDRLKRLMPRRVRRRLTN